MRHSSRRHFLKTTTTGLAAPLILPHLRRGADSANGKLLGCIDLVRTRVQCVDAKSLCEACDADAYFCIDAAKR